MCACKTSINLSGAHYALTPCTLGAPELLLSGVAAAIQIEVLKSRPHWQRTLCSQLGSLWSLAESNRMFVEFATGLLLNKHLLTSHQQLALRLRGRRCGFTAMLYDHQVGTGRGG